MCLQLTVKKTYCTRKNCLFCVPYMKPLPFLILVVSLPFQRCSTLGTAQEVLDCPLLSMQRFLYPEIEFFFFLLLWLHEGVRGKKPYLTTTWSVHLPQSLPLTSSPTPLQPQWLPGTFSFTLPYCSPGNLIHCILNCYLFIYLLLLEYNLHEAETMSSSLLIILAQHIVDNQ